MKKEDRR